MHTWPIVRTNDYMTIFFPAVMLRLTPPRILTRISTPSTNQLLNRISLPTSITFTPPSTETSTTSAADTLEMIIYTPLYILVGVRVGES